MAIVVAFIAAACGGGGDGVAPEVALEARWQCDVQRQTFDDLGALDAELNVRLANSGLTRVDYDAFKEELGASAELRNQVADEYETYCLS
ncbi:hypothetical protein BMS3Bbin02_02119 [bacterium BMS3Bbin02]|nr:hypothetical protein BMS3Bbin02_02119 [bacterium BMS3Bbin02]